MTPAIRIVLFALGGALVWDQLLAVPVHPAKLGLSPPYFRAAEGVSVARPADDRHEPKCAEYALLGLGFNGAAYRVQRPEKTVTRKGYKDKSTRDGDRWLLERYLEASEAGDDVGFNIPATWIEDRNAEGDFTGEHYFYYDDLGGEDLTKVLLDPAVDSRVKAWLEYDYERRLDRWRRFVRLRWKGNEGEARGYQVDFDTRRGQIVRGEGHSPSMREHFLRFPYRWVQINIEHQGTDGSRTWRAGPTVVKSDSVVVDPYTLEMYLVDPD